MEQDNFVKNVRYIVDFHKKYGKKSFANYTKEEQNELIEKCDQELVEDLVSSFGINPDDLTWEWFYPRYQQMHKEKYGIELI